jgi:hypothetical protein
MRLALLASTCLVTIGAALPLGAQTTIETRVTDPVRTSTVKAGGPDDLRITNAGSVVTTVPVAVTVDSANRLTNEGLIQITNVDNATGVLITAGSGAGVVHSGRIIVDETYEATDDDKDGDLDGPFAAGTGRTGLATQGAYAGPITVNAGATVTVEGRNSAGIALNGRLGGNFSHDGSTTVVGDNAVGIRLGDVGGNVRLGGTVTGIGQGAVGARVDGNITGQLVVQGAIASTGYRYTSAPADPSKLDADDLRQGGSALVIAGDVAGGIILAVPPRTIARPTMMRTRTGSRTARRAPPRSSATAPRRQCRSARPIAQSPSARWRARPAAMA